jgi:hypothetical protein
LQHGAANRTLICKRTTASRGNIVWGQATMTELDPVRFVLSVLFARRAKAPVVPPRPS